MGNEILCCLKGSKMKQTQGPVAPLLLTPLDINALKVISVRADVEEQGRRTGAGEPSGWRGCEDGQDCWLEPQLQRHAKDRIFKKVSLLNCFSLASKSSAG